MANDDPTTRVGKFAAKIEQFERTFNAARIYPEDAESRERFGDNYLFLQGLREKQERRSKWIATFVSAVAVAILTALCMSSAPFLLKVWSLMGK